MQKLTIKLSGEIQNSNFEQWKTDLVEQLKQVDTKLVDDSDFAAASKHVKSFKAAEKALKTAKESAINQAADINALFDAIDEVAEETRQVRLTLERQIRDRKKEIRESYEEQGHDRIAELLKRQSADFQLIDHGRYTDEDIIDDALKGKASTKGLQQGVDTALAGIEQQINAKADLVKQNAAAIDSLASGYKVLFQDRGALLDLPKDELDKIIDSRIRQYSAEQQRSSNDSGNDSVDVEAVDELTEPSTTGDPELDAGAERSASSNDVGDTEFRDYQIAITINSRQIEAEQLCDTLKQQYLENPLVKKVELKADW